MAGNSWAQCKLVWNGDRGGRTWQGDAGGINLRGDVWLCEVCTDAFLEFIKPFSERPQLAGDGK